ncbi:MAG: hypothetical protein OEV37_03410 [Candidatus Berkelbacteria bacterium]|nr:hypothetical protein [Candidatus Berkelbacteria bacterium]
MDLIDQILSQAKNFLICPVCKNHYQTGEIKLRGFIDNTYIFQAFCARGHQPLIVTYLASLQRLEKPIGAYFHPLSGEKITEDLVLKAEENLDKFDGNFKKIWI